MCKPILLHGCQKRGRKKFIHFEATLNGLSEKNQHLIGHVKLEWILWALVLEWCHWLAVSWCQICYPSTSKLPWLYFIAFFGYHVFTFLSPTLNVNSLRSSLLPTSFFFYLTLLFSIFGFKLQNLESKDDKTGRGIHWFSCTNWRERTEQELPLNNGLIERLVCFLSMSIMFKGMDSRARLLEFKSHLCHLGKLYYLSLFQ